MGRPTDYTPELASQICERLADGESLRAICRDESMPARSTVFRWLAEDAAFQDQYARAREAQADALAEDILDIADDGRRDYLKDPESGREIVDHDHIARARLRVDARKWYAGKVAPKKYGDKATVALTNPEGGPVQIEKTFSADEAAARYRDLLRTPAP